MKCVSVTIQNIKQERHIRLLRGTHLNLSEDLCCKQKVDYK